MLAIEQMYRGKLDKWEVENRDILKSYVRGEELIDANANVLLKLCTYTYYYDIPYDIKWDVNDTFKSLMNLINKIPNVGIDKIREIMRLN